MHPEFLIIAALLTLALPAYATPKTITGNLVDGGGLDDMALHIKSKKGKEIRMYCNTECGDWFESGIELSNDEIQGLKKSYLNKKVRVTYNYEKNKGRIAGPGDEERFNFIKKITFIR